MSSETSRTASTTSRRSRDAGYVLALAALLMTGMIGFTALAVDVGSWFAHASFLQRNADAASLAGVTYMPNYTRAQAEVNTVLRKNGIVDGQNDVNVDIQRVGNARLRVSITDGSSEQFFSGLFTDDVVITRGATSEYIRPVPMGSPRNYLGTGRMLGDAGEPPDDNFWVSVSGYCARREHGDRMTPRTDSQGGGTFGGCNSTGTASQTALGANPEWGGAWGGRYFYAVEIDDGDDTGGENWPFNPVIEVYSAPHCQGQATNPANDDGADPAAQRRYTYRLRANDNVDPAQATVLQTTIRNPSDCNAWGGAWGSMGTLSAVNGSGTPTGTATEGIYYLEIEPVEPLVKIGAASQEGQNRLSIRARDVSWGTADSAWPCTADASTVVGGAELRTDCPKVYGLTHLGVQVDFPAGTGAASPFLADIGSEHAGRRVQVELFDAAENMNSVEILDPLGNPVSFDWEVGCQDGTFESEGPACPSTENDPDPAGADSGRGPFLNRNIIDVAGTVPWANKPYNTRNSQDTRFSDNLLRLSFDLPTNAVNPTWYSGNTWFRIRYTPPGAAGVNDRTTWSVQILGDPVRLVE